MRVISGRIPKEKVILEFTTNEEFNEFSNWITSQKNIELSELKILSNKYVVMTTISIASLNKIY